MTDVALADALPGLAIVARSIPATKERIVRLARSAGHLVAVTGDGVNDAPALHAADVAVAMGSGTAVAKEASDLVLNDDSFATLVYGIEEGRRIVDNVQKGLVFLLSTHVALLGLHPHRDDRRVQPGAPADPGPVARAVHRPVRVDRLRTRAGGAGHHDPTTAACWPTPVDARAARADRRRRRLQRGRRAVADDVRAAPARAWPLAGLHRACPRPGRPGVREPQPGAAGDDPAAEWLPAGRVPGHRGGPGPHPVRATASRTPSGPRRWHPRNGCSSQASRSCRPSSRR